MADVKVPTNSNKPHCFPEGNFVLNSMLHILFSIPIYMELILKAPENLYRGRSTFCKKLIGKLRKLWKWQKNPTDNITIHLNQIVKDLELSSGMGTGQYANAFIKKLLSKLELKDKVRLKVVKEIDCKRCQKKDNSTFEKVFQIGQFQEGSTSVQSCFEDFFREKEGVCSKGHNCKIKYWIGNKPDAIVIALPADLEKNQQVLFSDINLTKLLHCDAEEAGDFVLKHVGTFSDDEEGEYAHWLNMSHSWEQTWFQLRGNEIKESCQKTEVQYRRSCILFYVSSKKYEELTGARM